MRLLRACSHAFDHLSLNIVTSYAGESEAAARDHLLPCRRSDWRRRRNAPMEEACGGRGRAEDSTLARLSSRRSSNSASSRLELEQHPAYGVGNAVAVGDTVVVGVGTVVGDTDGDTVGLSPSARSRRTALRSRARIGSTTIPAGPQGAARPSTVHPVPLDVGVRGHGVRPSPALAVGALRSSATASATSACPAEFPVAVTRPIRMPSAFSPENCRISTEMRSSVAMSLPVSCTVAVTTRLLAANVHDRGRHGWLGVEHGWHDRRGDREGEDAGRYERRCRVELRSARVVAAEHEGVVRVAVGVGPSRAGSRGRPRAPRRRA